MKSIDPSLLSTPVHLLRARALQHPDKVLFRFLKHGEIESGTLTAGELDQQARSIGAMLQHEGLSGQRVLLAYPPSGLEFITAFFGCLYAGAVAVPVYPPRPGQDASLFSTIAADAQATVALTAKQLQPVMAKRARSSAVRWLTTDGLSEDLSAGWRDPNPTAEGLAFLQYTSGSTSTPKGVMVGHGNLMHNLRMIHDTVNPRADEVGVSWAPLYHDMGLIGGVFQTVYSGHETVLMSPLDLLQRPMRWLEAIARYRAALSFGPNFAYDLVVRSSTPEQRAVLDLSSWRVALNGAEPVRAETMARFSEAFQPARFRPEAFFPAYGLAEATLFASGGDPNGLPRQCTVDGAALGQNRVVPAWTTDPDSRTLVSSGRGVTGQRIVIVDPEALAIRADGEVGEIWLSGPNVTHGYWNQPEATVAAFGATLLETAEGPFLRTGDLGFLQHGELFVTGRLKDLLIIHGRNHYPQDLERTMEASHPAIRPGCSAAFAIETGSTESVAVVVEVDDRQQDLDLPAIAEAIRLAVASDHELALHSVQLLRARTIPKTSSGKIRRHACRIGFADQTLAALYTHSAETKPIVRARPDRPLVAPATVETAAIRTWLTAIVARQLAVEPAAIDVDAPFVSFGLSSVDAIGLSGELGTWLGRPLPPTLIFDYPTIAAVAGHLGAAAAPAIATSGGGAGDREAIAIVGIGCRFPGGVNDLDGFWRLLENGIDAITEVPADRWDIDAYYDADANAPNKMTTRFGGFVSEVDRFDAGFFGISPKEAISMDPQQRLLLETTWEALEGAGIAPETLAGSSTGVFIGLCTHDYQRKLIRAGHMDPYSGTGNAASVAAGRIAYTLGLQGPALAVDTACSSSLVSVHLACQSLHTGESSLAVAGGVNLLLEPEGTIYFSKLRAMSPSGRCKTFAASADGYVRAEGCGMVVLKRLSDAQRDGDPILALVKGSAVNQDGRSNGLTAPNGPAQQAVIRQALRQAGVAPGQVGYLECHGTGTSLGDPIEVQALSAVLGEGRSADEPIVVGSVKSNIGHSEGAAGVAGLIKAVLTLQRKRVPKSLHFEEPNPHVPWSALPVKVASEAQPWPSQGKVRIAGVSSFSISGTNAHVVLAEAPAEAPAATIDSSVHLLPLSAKTLAALRDLARRYAVYLEAHDLLLPDIAHTMAVGRNHFETRLAIVASSTADAVAKLTAYAAGNTLAGLVTGRANPARRPQAASIARGKDGERAISLETLGRLYTEGADIDWHELHAPNARRRVSLPSYAFQRQRYWVDAKPNQLNVEVKELSNRATTTGTAGVPDMARRLQRALPSERPMLLRVWLQSIVAEVLGVADASTVDTATGFQQLGMDSLMAVDLRERWQGALGLVIPVTVVFNYPSIDDLAAYLIGELNATWNTVEAPLVQRSPEAVSALENELMEIEALLS